jgi:hypothetical protein
MDARVKPAHDESCFFKCFAKNAMMARPGDVGAGLVVTRPLVAVEAVE